MSNEGPGHEAPAITDRFRRSLPLPTSHLSAVQPFGASSCLRPIHIASLIKPDKKEAITVLTGPRKIIGIAFIGMGPAAAGIKSGIYVLADNGTSGSLGLRMMMFNLGV